MPSYWAYRVLGNLTNLNAKLRVPNKLFDTQLSTAWTSLYWIGVFWYQPLATQAEREAKSLRTNKASPPSGKVPLWERQRPQVTESLLQEITQRLVEALHPQKVILFGSYAGGTPHKDSDIDLLVIMDTKESKIQRYVHAYEVAHIDLLPMDMLVRTPAEVAERLAKGDTFMKEILEKGKVLYQNDTL